MRAVLLAIIALAYAIPAASQTLDPFQIVGHTTTTHTGGEGIRTFTLACQADFGAAARMCTSEEVLNTIVWPTLTDAAWVRPIFVLPSVSGAAVEMGGLVDSAEAMSCQGWTSDGATTPGLIVRPSGAITNRFAPPGEFQILMACGTPRPVACCRRVPEPSASLLVPVGSLACFGFAKSKAGA